MARNSQPERRPRRLRLEALEDRRLLAGVPYGALPDDTAEYLLGKVAVTPVFLESNGDLATESQDWTAAQIAETKNKIQQAMDWWSQTLDELNTVHSLEFVYDFTYANTPVETGYEPIDGSSGLYAQWVNDFLDHVEGNTSADVHDDIRAFNHSQRIALDANWAFTIIVVDSDEDLDGAFASGPYSRAFAFAGGRMFISPSSRPASTFAHEMAHIFWARDEYSGGGSHTDRRGYYDAQNLNAARSGYVQQDSLMASGGYFTRAWVTNVTSDSSMAMLGWRDTDGNGVFDVLDVPHTMQASGSYDASTGLYRLTGNSHVGTLPNQNSSGLQSDITINQIDELQYSIDSGAWQTAGAFDAYETDFDVEVPMGGGETIQFRTVTIDDGTGLLVTQSNLFSGGIHGPNTTELPGISGFVFNDTDENGVWDDGEFGLPGAVVQLTDQFGSPLPQQGVEPDDHANSVQLNNINPAVQLTAEGTSLVDTSVISRAGASSTGFKAFAHFISPGVASSEWIQGARELVMTFTSATTRVQIDVIGDSDGDVGRLEAFDAAGNLIGRVSTMPLQNGEVESLEIVAGGVDIAWAIAYGFNGDAVRLDNLQFGAETTTTTDARGSYLLDGVGAGDHYVQVATGDPTAPVNGLQHVSSTGDPVQDVNFGVFVANPWHNFANRFDVDGSGQVDQNDLRLVFSNLLVLGARTLQLGVDDATPMVDINNDGLLTTEDLRELLARVILGPGGGESEPEAEPPLADEPLELRSTEPPTLLPLLNRAAPPRLAAIDAVVGQWQDDDWWDALDQRVAPLTSVLETGQERQKLPATKKIRNISGTSTIRHASKRGLIQEDRWFYVPSEDAPADEGSESNESSPDLSDPEQPIKETNDANSTQTSD